MTDDTLFEDVKPFSGDLPVPVHESGGALVDAAIQREIAEVQAAMAIAKRFPRNQKQAFDQIMVACQRPSLAEEALYSYSRGGTEITGPSIRLAEAIIQLWGNADFGIKEVDQRNGESTVMSYAWDLETNTRQTKTFQVKHRRYTKKGTYNLEDPRDIYEMVANLGARRLRACILGVVPGDIVSAAQAECEKTLKTKADISPDTVKKMVEKFGEYGVTKAQIEKRIQRSLDSITPAQMVSMRKIFNSMRDGMSKAEDWFEVGTTSEAKPEFKPEFKEEPNKERKPRSAKGRPRREEPAPQESRMNKVADKIDQALKDINEIANPAQEPPQAEISADQEVDQGSIEEMQLLCAKLNLKEEIISVMFTEDKNRRSFAQMNNREAGKCLGYLFDLQAKQDEGPGEEVNP